MTAITAILVGLGVLFVGLNWLCIITSLTTKKHSSLFPLLGGLLIFTWLLLDSNRRHLAGLGLVVDPGCWAVVFAILDAIAHSRKTSAAKLTATFSGTFEDVKVLIRLYRPDYYEIKLERPSLSVPGWLSSGSLGTWNFRHEVIDLISHTDTKDKPRRAALKKGGDGKYYEVIESPDFQNGPFDAPEFPPVGFRFEIVTTGKDSL